MEKKLQFLRNDFMFHSRNCVRSSSRRRGMLSVLL